MAFLLLSVGVALLIGGAETIVRGASRLAALFRISPLVIGLTVVAYATSAPELVVGVESILREHPGIALGNVVGSSIFNLLLILGLSAVIAPLPVARQVVWWDVPVMIAASCLLLVLGLDGTIGGSEGVLLCASLLAYSVCSVARSRREDTEVQRHHADASAVPIPSRDGASLSILFVFAGLGLLALGAHWFVTGAVMLARALGLSDLIIGLTVVAVGTSLPELATSVVAALRGERDIAVGNAVGSNICNVLFVVGLSSLASPYGIAVDPAALRFDVPAMIALAIACFPIFFTGYAISRWEGLAFLGYYVAYALYLILKATQHEALPAFSSTMILFVVPLTVLTLTIAVLREFTGGRPRAPA